MPPFNALKACRVATPSPNRWAQEWLKYENSPLETHLCQGWWVANALHWVSPPRIRVFYFSFSSHQQCISVQPLTSRVQWSFVRQSETRQIRPTRPQCNFPSIISPIHIASSSTSQETVIRRYWMDYTESQDETAQHNDSRVGDIHPRCSAVRHSLAHLG